MKYKQTHKTNNQGILNSVLHTLELTTLTFQTKILLERESIRISFRIPIFTRFAVIRLPFLLASIILRLTWLFFFSFKKISYLTDLTNVGFNVRNIDVNIRKLADTLH